MVEFLKDKPDNVIAISVAGHVTEEDYDKVNPQLELHAEKQDDIRMYLEIVDLKGVTVPAIFKDIKAGFKYWKKFSKLAVTGNPEWLEDWSEIGDWVTPGVDVKFFEPGEKQKAMEWLK